MNTNASCVSFHLILTVLFPQDKKVIEKVYGKQKVYVVNQELFEKVNDSEIKSMDTR